ncbi:MAG: putative sulfate exporter family transporter [Leeuwenhoekiella sp.]
MSTVYKNKSEIVFFALLLICCTPLFSPPIALAAGLIFAQILKNPFEEKSNKAVHFLLKVSVVGLGFGMNIFSAMAAGKEGFLFTVVSIVLTITLGLILGKYFHVDKKISELISSGTAICGGSAIAAISPIIKADAKQISIAIGVVFLLNSIALFIFPVIGHYFHLSQNQFGIWSAIAIHDTSSVVGAAQVYGSKALEIATTVKLARALWILPVSVLFAIASKQSLRTIKIPYFIGLFVLAILMNTYIPQVSFIAPTVVELAKIGLTITLFLIGSSLTFSSLKGVGLRPLLQAIIIWVFIAVGSLTMIVLTIK